MPKYQFSEAQKIEILEAMKKSKNTFEYYLRIVLISKARMNVPVF